MGRKKIAITRIENPMTRQMTYGKRRDGILRKANELATLCDTDVAVVMFPPNGRHVCFASNGRKIEDIFLSYVDRPDELRGGPINNEAFLSRRLKQLKYEEEMLEKITIIEGLEEKLKKLVIRQNECEGRMSYYEPNVEKIGSVLEATVYQQFLKNSIQCIQSAKANLFGNQIFPHRLEDLVELLQAPMDNAEDAASVTEISANANQNGNCSSTSSEEEDSVVTSANPNVGPHLSLSFLQGSKKWEF